MSKLDELTRQRKKSHAKFKEFKSKVYDKFIEWLGRTWWGLPASDQLMPLIQARYSVKEAEFLTGIHHSAATLE